MTSVVSWLARYDVGCVMGPGGDVDWSSVPEFFGGLRFCGKLGFVGKPGGPRLAVGRCWGGWGCLVKGCWSCKTSIGDSLI